MSEGENENPEKKRDEQSDRAIAKATEALAAMRRIFATSDPKSFAAITALLKRSSASSAFTSLSGSLVSSGPLLRHSDEVVRTETLYDEIRQLRLTVENQAKDLACSEEEKGDLRRLAETYEKLVERERLAFLLTKVTERANNRLFDDEALRGRFMSQNEEAAFVVSVDIRRSTDLMLKARSPADFAKFITTVCDDLETIFKESFGLIDKFTGDGLLVIFPEFFSGPDAGMHALSACSKAIRRFDQCYQEFRSRFSTILQDVGLGIGIDYGDVRLVKVASSLTAVGHPVVYACRLGAAPAGRIYANQGAYEQINANYARFNRIVEATITVKHEGPVLCYDIEPIQTASGLELRLPGWLMPETTVEPKEKQG